jgi:N-acetylmuramoyl-L-alanine amidase
VSVNVVEYPLAWRGTLRPRTATRRIVIHHAASAGDVDAPTIHRWHLAITTTRYVGIMYHYVIRLGGQIERGRPEDALGGHAGPANVDSIGICLAGNIDQREPPMVQMMALVALIRDIQSRYGELQIIGHSDVMPTACPGRFFPWQWLRGELAPRPLPQIQQRVGMVWRGQHIGDGFLIGDVAYAPVRVLGERMGLRVDWRDGTVHLQ